MPVLQFKGKTTVENYHHTVPHHVLEIDPKLSLSKKPSLEDNLIIEGDNLLALKSLLPTHAGRIKCIYIDPPYNTGNERWVFNDNLTQPQFKEWIGREVGKEGEDATRHDKWCCMMYPRLQLLKELLREDGALFVSIDDNEVHALRMLMDETMGFENFVAAVVWQKRTSPDARAVLGAAHDYVLVYAKNLEAFKLTRNPLPLSDERKREFQNPDRDPKGLWASVDLTGQTGHATPNQFYTIVTPSGKRYPPPKGRCWALTRSTYLRLQKEGRIWFGRAGKSRPRLKRYLTEVEGTAPWTWWPHEEAGHNQEATRELVEILGRADVFPNPKPVRLIHRILQIATDQDSLVLDSFSGSGTTAHAVLALNKEDGGDRKFILVQMPHDTKNHEKQGFNICEKISAERVRRVIQGYSYKDGTGKRVKVSGLGGSFTYARVGKVLLDEHRGFSRGLPTYEDLAKYIFYTETSQPLDTKDMDPKTGRIGEHSGTSYYLLYTPNGKEDRALDREFLKALNDRNDRKVVYCEKLWLHPDEMREFGDVRAMLLPFNLK